MVAHSSGEKSGHLGVFSQTQNDKRCHEVVAHSSGGKFGHLFASVLNGKRCHEVVAHSSDGNPVHLSVSLILNDGRCYEVVAHSSDGKLVHRDVFVCLDSSQAPSGEKWELPHFLLGEPAWVYPHDVFLVLAWDMEVLV